MRRKKQKKDPVLRHEFSLSGWTRISIGIGIVLFFVLSVFVYKRLYSQIREAVVRDAERNIINISELNADSIERSLNNRQMLLETFAINLSSRRNVDIERILQEMNAYASMYDFYNMGILTEGGTLHLTLGMTVDVSDIPQYMEAWERDFYISESFLLPGSGGYRLNLFSAPVKGGGREKAYVVTATCRSMDLTERINISALRGKGTHFILNKKGEVVIYPYTYEDADYLRLMNFINGRSEIIPNQTESTTFTFDGDEYYARFEQLNVSDWYLMTCAKEQDVFGNANRISYLVMLGLSLLWILLVGAIAFIFYLCARFKERAQQAMFYDSLLKIENGEYLKVYFSQIPDEEFSAMALAFLDVDKFKEFNYIYGDECGDELLRYIAASCQKELPGDRVFRYLADNFVLLIHCQDRKEVEEKILVLLRRFAEDMENGRIQPFDISIGIRLMKEGETMQRIMSDALLAKGTVKGIQVQQYAFYDEQIRTRRMSYMEMESDFAKALREKEFQVYYQPKFDMRTGEIVGAEALVRWIKPDGTMISPGMFIPCFESSRQITRLDEYVLENVCVQMKKMEADGISVKPVSVNLSRVHLRHNGILAKIHRTIEQTGIDPENLSFEITESALYEDSIPLRYIITFLHHIGCKVSMDDYGMGVSGPNSLATNAFDVIKLDKSFIDRIGDPKMESVIRSTIHLSSELGMTIIAEGVEEKQQAEHLVEWGCYYAQGYYYSKPVPYETYRKLLEDTKRGE